MPNPTPTPAPALTGLPEAWRNDTEVMLRVGRASRNDAERAEADLPPIHPDHAFRFTGVEIEELCAAVARATITAALAEGEKDAARWRAIRPLLDVDGDLTDEPPYGKHVQWITVDEGKLHDMAQAGWTHTVESIVDAAIARDASLSTAQTGEVSHG